MALALFEEYRFIIEVIIAEQLFVWSFAKRKRNFWPILIGGFLVLALISGLFPFIQEPLLATENMILIRMFSVAWYISLVVLTLIHIKLHYKITWSDVLFMGIAGYSLQHIEYVLVNEILARGIWPSLLEHLFLYFIICLVTTFVWYGFINMVFAKKLKVCDGTLYEDNPKTILFFVTLLILLMFAAFLGQHLFVNGANGYTNVNYLGATYDCLTSVLILIVQYSIFKISTLNREKEIIKQLLYERQKQYTMSRDNIEIINLKCHDMKHQLNALRQAKDDEVDAYISEVEKSIMIYDSVVKTDNEVLNTILSEKSLYCEKHHIKLTSIIDSSQLDFMGTQDIYVLLGNALDNAIECVIHHKDKEKRVISLTISASDNFLSIQTNNYLYESIEFEDGLPISKKKNKKYHGFGVKSMKHIAEKYGGSMITNVENDIFMLQVVIPIPAEFSRLLKISKEGKQPLA